MNITGTQLSLTQEIKEYAEKKLGELERFIPEGTAVQMDVELEKTTNHHRKGEIFRAEVNVSLPGGLLRAEAQEEMLFKAINEVKNEMQRELVKYKDAQSAKQRKGGRALKEELTSADPSAEI